MSNTKIILSLVLIYFSGCSTAPVDSASSQESSAAAEVDSADKNKMSDGPQKAGNTDLVEMKPVSASAAAASEAPRVEATKKQYQVIKNALSTQNSELLKTASLDILQTDYRDPVALNTLAMSYFQKGLYETAEVLLNKLLVVDPKSSSAHSNLGLVYLARNDRREAMESFKKSLDIDSDNQAALENLGAMYVRVREYEKASGLLDKVDKRSEFSNLNYAVALSGLGKFKEAEDIYEDILSENASNKQVMYNLAFIKIEKLSEFQDGLDLLNRLKFVDANFGSEIVIKELENKAKAGLK